MNCVRSRTQLFCTLCTDTYFSILRLMVEGPVHRENHSSIYLALHELLKQWSRDSEEKSLQQLLSYEPIKSLCEEIDLLFPKSAPLFGCTLTEITFSQSCIMNNWESPFLLDLGQNKDKSDNEKKMQLGELVDAIHAIEILIDLIEQVELAFRNILNRLVDPADRQSKERINALWKGISNTPQLRTQGMNWHYDIYEKRTHALRLLRDYLLRKNFNNDYDSGLASLDTETNTPLEQKQ